MSTLFGSSPKVENLGPQPTTTPQQQQFLGAAGTGLQGMLPIQPYPGPTTAPLTDQQQAVVNQAAGVAGGMPSPGATAPLLSGAAATDQALMGFQPGQAAGASYDPSGLQVPTVAPGQFGAPQVQTGWQTPNINSQQAFEQGVVQPLTQNFESQIIPALKGVAGTSAGGIYSSDTSRQGQLAATGLNTQLAAAGANLAYQSAAANQQAQLATNQLGATTQEANQAAQLSAQQQQLAALQGNQQAQQAWNQLQAGVGLANAQQAQQNQQFNVGAGLAGAGIQQGAATAAPGIAAGAYSPYAAAAQTLASLFPTISAPQTTQWQGIANALQNYYLPQQLSIQGYGTLGQAGTAPTQQPQTAVLPGQTGLIPSLVGGLGSAFGSFAGSPAGSAALAGLFSDKRMKTDIVPLGRNTRLDLPVYEFRYKTDPEGVRRVGYMAHDVEADYPEAVAQDEDGMKYVSYGLLALKERWADAPGLASAREAR